ncbi:LuxR C-terminal-related transcriptional regulator [Nocardia sp. 2YAB30]|uniref:helix-turn-helix transcriptional regulator n=1 Tax=unclassified Nocardia TaxID=2637762 RepID=UPI003F9E8F53
MVLWESAVLVAAGDNDTAIEVIQQGLWAAHETFRFVEAGPILLVKWAQALTALGRWNEALGLVDEPLTEQLPPLNTAALLLCHARIVLARGDVNAAAASVETAEPLLGDSLWAMQYQIQLRTVKFEIAHVAGRPQRAVDFPAEAVAAHPHEAWALVTAVARSGGVAAELDAVAAALPVTTAVDIAHRAVFRAARSGRPADWTEAASAWRALRQPHELARSLLEAAEAELAVGNRTAAGELLRAVLAAAEELAATPLTEHARRLADRAGVTLDEAAGRPAQQAAPSPSGLTPRELDVLRLVAKELSNRQIAAELFISGNTAGVHVSRILTKLGATTRTEAAATARARGLLDLVG